MRIRIETAEHDEEEIVIKCHEYNERIRSLASSLENALRSQDELTLYAEDAEYYIPKHEILFFETFDAKVFAHTKGGVYVTRYKLFELERVMPSYFVRISKSTIANIKEIISLRRELTGNGEIAFRECDKKVFFSRGYYAHLRTKIEEVRFLK